MVKKDATDNSEKLAREAHQLDLERLKQDWDSNNYWLCYGSNVTSLVVSQIVGLVKRGSSSLNQITTQSYQRL